MTTYTGKSGNDTLVGSKGADVIYGYGGNDSITAGDGDDTAYGGDGNDTIYGGNGYDSLFGDAGNDLIYGGNDHYDDIYGGDGDDTLYAGDSNDDWAYGGAGNDQINMGAGDDIAFGEAGNDTLSGGAGNDSLHAGYGNDLVLGEQGKDTITGNSGNDTLDGGTENDRVHGGSGNDLIYGGAGDDWLAGDTHEMRVSYAESTGGTSAKQVFVNDSPVSVDLYWINPNGSPVFITTIAAGGSTVQATGAGYNWYISETSSGTMLGHIEGSATNSSYSYGPDFDDTIYGGAGNDTISGDFGNDVLDGGSGNDQIHGGLGNDLIFGGEGNDTVYGGSGNDTVTTGSGADSISLGDGDDVVNDWQDNGGNDTIRGEAGNDLIYGGGDDDLIYGGDGNDTLSGGAGNDSVYGGAGNDHAEVSEDHGWDYYDLGENTGDSDAMLFYNWQVQVGVTVTFTGPDAGTYAYAGGNATGQFVGAEQVCTTEFADTINAAADTDGATFLTYGGSDSVLGGSGSDHVEAGSGDDTVAAGGGNDTVYGGAGYDTLSGGAGNDLIHGDADADLLYGGTGDDTLVGGAGNDTLSGGAGNDSLYGGEGYDLYVFDKAGGHDTVVDFDMTLAGNVTVDQLDVSALQNGNGGPITWHDIKIGNDGAGNAVLVFPEGEVVLLKGTSPRQITKVMAHKMGIPCFAAGTLIDTPQGRRPVQDLRAGDQVTTAMGPMPVIWAGGRQIGAAELAARPLLQPVILRKGALGNDLPLVVSRQHGLAVQGPDGQAVLVRAAQLVALGRGAFRQAQGRREMAYHHFLLPRHALIRANGAWAETLWPGPTGLAALDGAARAAILRVVPGLSLAMRMPDLMPVIYGQRALPLVTARVLRKYEAIRAPVGAPHGSGQRGGAAMGDRLDGAFALASECALTGMPAWGQRP